MKRDMNELNLQHAFPPEPEGCHQALMQAARSVREEEPMKKYTFRTALIAALIIAAMMAVAIAATNGGLVGWFQNDYHATLPQAAQEILNATEKSTLEAGPVLFTVNELLCDGKIAYLTAEAQLKEPGSALLYPDCDDIYGRIGEVMARRLNHPDINEKTTWLEAAQITGLPLYNVGAWLELEESALDMTGEEMAAGSVLENGNILLVRMIYFIEEYPGETLPVEAVARTLEFDMQTEDFIRNPDWKAAEKRDISIHGVTAEKRYAPDQPTVLSEVFTLTGATARQTCAGVYVYLCADAASPMTLEDLWQLNFEWGVLNADGSRFPTGISLTAELLDGSGNRFPTEVPPEEIEFSSIQYMMMITADTLPDSLIVTDGSTSVAVR